MINVPDNFNVFTITIYLWNEEGVADMVSLPFGTAAGVHELASRMAEAWAFVRDTASESSRYTGGSAEYRRLGESS